MSRERKEPVDMLEALGGIDPELLGKSPEQEEIDSIQELGVSSEDARRIAESDLNFLSGIAMPMVFKFFFPPVMLAVWTWLLGYVHKERSFPQLALGLPRGFAKSTLMKLFLLFCILFTRRKFILIVGAVQGLAENILADVCDMLEEPNIIALFGDYRLGMEKDTQKLKKFGFRGRTIILAAVGAEGSVRGLNLKNERPDIILMDDIQSRECADSEVQSESLEKWMIGTLMKAKAPTGCMFLFVANMYPTKYSILRKLKKNSRWVKFITGGILSDGTSLWEDLQPIEQLLNEYQSDLEAGHPEIFRAEVLNDEEATGLKFIDLSKLPELPCEAGDVHAGSFIIIDPATDKKNADANSVGYFEVHDAKPVLMELMEGIMSPGELIRNALKLAVKHNCTLVVTEGNAYQYTLLYWFNFICQQIGLRGIEFVPIYSGTKAKNVRILNMLKSYAVGEIFVHPDCKLQVHSQIADFNPLKTDNTDGLLDLLTYAPRVIADFGPAVMNSGVIQMQEFEALEVIEHNSCF